MFGNSWDIFVGGKSKYDDVAAELLERHKADAVVAVIVNGDRGNGAVAKEKLPMQPQVRRALARTLEAIAHDLLEGVEGPAGGGRP